ncbi:hypothetical protein JCM10908_007317 [Rhodotorula pacifica]|uniref:glycosyltransferase family 2 protein n=1 Tax=Rhodotorula pacifica TaxID=1495444 RepID=UPI0031751964
MRFPRRFFGGKPASIPEESTLDEEKAHSIVEIDQLPELDQMQTNEAYAFMASHIFRNCTRKRWMSEGGELPDGVAIRKAKRNYAIYPAADPRMHDFTEAVKHLNCAAAMTMSAEVVRLVVNSFGEAWDTFSLTAQDNVQIVDTMADLAHARAPQHACFIRAEKRLVVWADKVDSLEDTAQDFESKLVQFVFNRTLRRETMPRSKTHSTLLSTPSSAFMSPSPSFASIAQFAGPDSADEKEKAPTDAEAGDAMPERRAPLIHSVHVGLGTALNIVLCALLMRTLLVEALWDGEYINLAILATLPLFFLICMFFCDNIIGIVLQIIAPIGQMSRNTLFYSAKPPVRMFQGVLPHITVMMPVYKESLEDVLAPTIESVSKAIKTYELQGGTASIIVCEDGMQLVDSLEIEKRKEYYDNWHCAWVARPKENRAGRFKKSSNLNVTMALSLRIEEIMDERRPTELDDLAAWTTVDEDRLYETALALALSEKENTVWASGNLRIGEYILMIDSDTRVPRDCLLDGACEMNASPEVGILQHCSGTFLAGAGFFENFIAFFTTSVNHSISWTTANGSTAPFMGHNAFLRWSALQHQALFNEDGKVWSEEHVSEDFVMTLCLNRAGYITRWATYSNLDFQEGVSLSCDDELNRWQKYAFGCSELVFNPFLKWFRKGPFSALYFRYLRGNTPLPSKISSSSYVASYWAIAVAPPLSLLYYCLQGWFAPVLSKAFFPSFGTLVAVIVVYVGGGTFATMISRYRSQSAPLRTCLRQGVVWLPASITFFTGLSFHVTTALLAHITGYNMQWSTTKKDLEMPTITEELPVIFKRFKITFLLGFVIIAGVAVLSTTVVPLEWRIEGTTVMFPLLWLACGHVLFPFILNPAIMLFRF